MRHVYWLHAGLYTAGLYTPISTPLQPQPLHFFPVIDTMSSRVHVSAASAADHLFFADCRKKSWIAGLGTHPDIHERIRRIERLASQYTELKG